MTPLHPSFGPTFRPYDRLTGQDLTDWQRLPLFAAARHFCTIHRHFGVADGLTVSLAGTTVTVEKGVAFDAHGRPLWLVETVSIQAKAGDWIVLCGEKPVEQQLSVPVPAPQRGEIAVRTQLNGKLPEFEPWEVPLAKVASSGAAVELDLSVRPIVMRAYRRPYIATGLVPGGTAAMFLKDARGWQVWIDTVAAGFLPSREADQAGHRRPGPSRDLQPPVYLVSIGRQTREDAQRLRTGQRVLDGSANMPHPPFISVSQVSHRGFLLTVDYGRSVPDLVGMSATSLEIRWIGIEPASARERLDRSTADQTEGVMMPNAASQDKLPWPEFRDDQRLTAPDLNDVQQTVRTLQWVHNRTLHDWGVAEGCAVTALPDRRAVIVQPGNALDILGREVIVSDPVQLTVPAQKLTSGPESRKTWWVTVSYREEQTPRDGDPTCRQHRVPLRFFPQAVVRWRDPEENDAGVRLEPGYDVILASVEIERGEVVSVTSAGRRSAAPSKRPYIYAGRTELRQCDIVVAQQGAETGTAQATNDDENWTRFSIDTSAGMFVAAPHYVFTLEWDQRDKPVVVKVQPFIEDAQAARFHLAMPADLLHLPTGARGLLQPWLMATLLCLAGAVLFPLLQSWFTQWAWSLSILSALGAALPSSWALARRWMQPTKDPDNAPVAEPAKSDATTILDGFVPGDLFGNRMDRHGSNPSWLIGTIGLPATAVGVHWLDPGRGEPWIWTLSAVCALLAWLINAWLSWQQRQPRAAQDEKDGKIGVTIAWVGIEV